MTDQADRIAISGVVRVPLAPAEAFDLFTPSGERAWVEGWSPRFPVPVENEIAPGTVFQTDHGGRRTTWVVAQSERGKTITYAQVGDGDRAGTVAVDCSHGTDDMTEVRVTYTLTALRDDAKPDLGRFAADYAEFLEHWERAIANALVE